MRCFLTFITTMLLLIAFTMGPPALAQNQPEQYQFVYHVTVRPGADLQYEDYVKKIAEAANKIGAAQSWSTFQISSGGPGGTYIVVLPFNTWAERDAWGTVPGMLTEAYGEEEAAKILRTGTASMASYRTTVSSLLPELSTHLDRSSSVAANYMISRSEVKPEKVMDYELVLSKIRAAEAKAAGSPRRIARQYVQGNRYTFITSTAFNTYAEREKWPSFSDYMGNMYGEEEVRQLLDKIRQATISWDTFELAYRPDLSRSADSPTTD